MIAVCDTSACTFGLKLHAEVSQTAIMKPAAAAGGRHWERRARLARKPARCQARVGSMLTQRLSVIMVSELGVALLGTTTHIKLLTVLRNHFERLR